MNTYRRYETCEKCGGPVTERQAYPAPILIQILFGVSCIAFLFLVDQLKGQRLLIWGWSAMQIILGVLLIIGRRKASKKVLVCIKCGVLIPS